jgi:glycerol-3-phosphate dehydrogenase
VDDGTGDTYDASRRAELVDHGKDDGIDGLFSAIGGKWTTSRDLAEKVTDVIVNRRGAKTSRCTTAVTPLPGGRIERFRMFADEQRRQYPGISSIEYLSRLYGACLPAMLSTHADTASMAPVGVNGDIAIQIDYALKEEMAVALEDVIMRRTGIGQLGRPTTATLEQTAAIMGAELGWNEDRKKNEIASLDRNFSLVSE